MPAPDFVSIRDRASLSLVRELVRERGSQTGLEEQRLQRLSVVATELAQNHLDHAAGGRIAVRRVTRGGVAGLEVVAGDRGRGIRDPTSALRETGVHRAGLGSGLAGALRLADELDFDIRLEEGCCLYARVFAGPVSPRREVAIFGAPCDGERVSGDDAAFVRDDSTLWLVIADGLGHGGKAREASARAVELAGLPTDDLVSHLRRCHDELGQLRGAVMALARWAQRQEELSLACIGNVRSRLARFRGEHRLGCAPGVVGAPPFRSPATERVATHPGDVFVAFTDGLPTQATLPIDDIGLLRDHPVAMAQYLFDQFRRKDDDTLIIVAR